MHPALVAVEVIDSLRNSHAELFGMIERASILFQSYLAIASLNNFLYMVYCSYYWVIVVYDLEPALSQRRLEVALGTTGWLAFTLSNLSLLVHFCELVVYEVCIF